MHTKEALLSFPLGAAGFLALAAAAQLAFLHSSSAALQCREQLASAERLVMPALTLFFCLSQVSHLLTPSHQLDLF